MRVERQRKAGEGTAPSRATVDFWASWGAVYKADVKAARGDVADNASEMGQVCDVQEEA